MDDSFPGPAAHAVEPRNERPSARPPIVTRRVFAYAALAFAVVGGAWAVCSLLATYYFQYDRDIIGYSFMAVCGLATLAAWLSCVGPPLAREMRLPQPCYPIKGWNLPIHDWDSTAAATRNEKTLLFWIRMDGTLATEGFCRSNPTWKSCFMRMFLLQAEFAWTSGSRSLAQLAGPSSIGSGRTACEHDPEFVRLLDKARALREECPDQLYRCIRPSLTNILFALIPDSPQGRDMLTAWKKAGL